MPLLPGSSSSSSSRFARSESPPGPLRSAALRITLAIALAGLLGATGCTGASGPRAMDSAGAELAREALGPGAVFATAELAAFDALAWCQAEARSAGESRAFARGGTVYPVVGGFSYAEPSVADGASPRLRYRLGPDDVLHFRHYPASAAAATGPSRHMLPIRDRRFVDRGDPLQRPIYYMTPDRRVRRYAAMSGDEGPRTLTFALRASNDRER